MSNCQVTTSLVVVVLMCVCLPCSLGGAERTHSSAWQLWWPPETQVTCVSSLACWLLLLLLLLFSRLFLCIACRASSASRLLQGSAESGLTVLLMILVLSLMSVEANQNGASPVSRLLQEWVRRVTSSVYISMFIYIFFTVATEVGQRLNNAKNHFLHCCHRVLYTLILLINIFYL